MVEIPGTISEKITLAIGGDAVAMGVVFEWFRPRLYAHALRICGNTPAAQDAVQDTFISAFTHLATLKKSGSFYPWLKRILINHCYHMMRKEKFDSFSDRHLFRDDMLHRSLEEHFDRISNAQRMHEALLFLSEELRSCVMLRYFSSVNSYEEMAQVLDIPVGTVRSRLSAARTKLSALFDSIEDAGDSAITEGLQWSGFYVDRWKRLYDDQQARSEFFSHLHPSLAIRFTSGMAGIGRELLEQEVNNDLYYGSRFSLSDATSSGNVTVMEGTNLNHPDYPDRCAPATAIVLFRKNSQVEQLHIFDSARV